MGPILGYVSDKISLQLALMLCGISVLLPGIGVFILLLKHKTN
jgi:hypothetical protein